MIFVRIDKHMKQRIFFSSQALFLQMQFCMLHEKLYLKSVVESERKGRKEEKMFPLFKKCFLTDVYFVLVVKVYIKKELTSFIAVREFIA